MMPMIGSLLEMNQEQWFAVSCVMESNIIAMSRNNKRDASAFLAHMKEQEEIILHKTNELSHLKRLSVDNFRDIMHPILLRGELFEMAKYCNARFREKAVEKKMMECISRIELLESVRLRLRYQPEVTTIPSPSSPNKVVKLVPDRQHAANKITDLLAEETCLIEYLSQVINVMNKIKRCINSALIIN